MVKSPTKVKVIHNHVVGRILDFMREGLPYKPLTRFVEKLMENPSRRAVNELYAFLEHKNMPLTPDGNFLAYKGVRERLLRLALWSMPQQGW